MFIDGAALFTHTVICPKFKLRNVTEMTWMDFSQAVFLEFRCPSCNIIWYCISWNYCIVSTWNEKESVMVLQNLLLTCSFHGLCFIKHLRLNAYWIYKTLNIGEYNFNRLTLLLVNNFCLFKANSYFHIFFPSGILVNYRLTLSLTVSILINHLVNTLGCFIHKFLHW